MGFINKIKEMYFEKKGNLSNLKEGAMALGFIAIFAAAIAIALDSFSGTLSAGYAKNITTSGLSGIANATSYMPTIGILLGVGALIAVVVSAFYWAKGK